MTSYRNHMKPIAGAEYVARLTVTIHGEHDDDSIMDYLLYPEASWTGKPVERFTYRHNPEFHPELWNKFPEAFAEYTLRYESKADMEADAEERKLFAEGVPDGFAEWETFSAMDVVSSGRAKAIEWAMNEDAQNDDEPYPLPEDNGTFKMTLERV